MTLRDRFDAILRQHPRLVSNGYGVLRSESDVIADNFERFAATFEWIGANLQPKKAINRRYSSYVLKHMAEAEIDYITNGIFIAAMIAHGYEMRTNCTPNPHFNVSEKSVKRVRERIDSLRR